VFDGTKYVERERMPADTAPDGKRCLTGDVTLDKAIPLTPAEKAAPGSGPSAPAPSKTGFSTVCGVTVGGQEYRYKCTVEGVAVGKGGRGFVGRGKGSENGRYVDERPLMFPIV
jgi:hypothetical protein